MMHGSAAGALVPNESATDSHQSTAFRRMLDCLSDAGSTPRTQGGQAYARCPAHDDRTASLSITKCEDGVLINCHAGCSVDDILAKLPLQRRDLFDTPRDKRAGYQVTAEYPYRDEGGTVLYVKERRWPKDFRQYVPTPNGREYRLNGVRRVIYRLPEVLEAIRCGQTVYVAEGEKDADSLVRAGVCATTWSDGAWKPGSSSKWRREYTASLSGARLVIVADDDSAGRNTAVTIADAVRSVAASVQVVLPATGKDATDHLAAGKTVNEFVPLSAATDSAEVEGQHRGQARVAYRLASEHGADLRHVRGLGWFTWDGSRWAEDKDGEPTRRVLETVRNGIRAAADMPRGSDRDWLLEDVRKCESAAGVAGVLTLVSAVHPVALSHERLDADPHLFSTPGGTVDLRSCSIRQGRREDHITKVAGAAPGGDGADLWSGFLERIMPDRDVREFLQRLMGMAMLGEVREHVLPIFTGTGRNGKGVFRDALMAAFGDYAHEADPALLMESKHERHGTFKMQLRGRRLVFCSETEKGRRFAEATVKRLVGGDPIEANRMHKDPIVFQPSHTLVMITNHLPEVSGDDPAIWARIRVVPFDVVIPPEEQDPALSLRIRAAAPAVLAWALEGWRSYQEQGLNPPEAVMARTAAYQASSDVLARFFAERAMVNRSAHVKARELFDAFAGWCRETGEQAPTEKAFAESMATRGFEKRKTGGCMVYRGIGLYAEGE